MSEGNNYQTNSSSGPGTRGFYALVRDAKDAAAIETQTKALYATPTDAEKPALD